MEKFKEYLSKSLQVQIVPFVTVDAIFLTEEVYNNSLNNGNLILEAKIYNNPIPGLKHYSYRIDNVFGEQKPGRQKHVHVFYDGEQLFAMNVDGTAHDGCHQVQVSDNVAKFMKQKGFTIPKNNIIEMKNDFVSRKLLTESKGEYIDLCTQIDIKAGQVLRSGLLFQLVESNCPDYTVLCNSKIKGKNIKELYCDKNEMSVKKVRQALWNSFLNYPMFDKKIVEIFDENKFSEPHSLFIIW